MHRLLHLTLALSLLSIVLPGCGGGEPAIDDTAAPSAEGIPKIAGETTAEPPGEEAALPTPPATDDSPAPSGPAPGEPPAPPSGEPPAGEAPTPPPAP